MTSQMGSSVSPGRPGSAPAVRLAGRAVTSAILTYFGLIVTNGGTFAKGSCGLVARPPGERPALGRPTISGVPSRRKTARPCRHGPRPGRKGFMVRPDRTGHGHAGKDDWVSRRK